MRTPNPPDDSSSPDPRPADPSSPEALDPYQHVVDLDEILILRGALAQGYVETDRDPHLEKEALLEDTHVLLQWLERTRIASVMLQGIFDGDLLPFVVEGDTEFALTERATQTYIDVDDFVRQRLHSRLRNGYRRLVP